MVTYIADRPGDIRLIKQAAPVTDFFVSERPDTWVSLLWVGKEQEDMKSEEKVQMNQRPNEM